MVKTDIVDKIFQQFIPELRKKFTIRKISTLAGLSYDATYRYVHFFIKEGAFKEEKVGAYSYISINLESDYSRKIIERISLSKTRKFLKKNVVVRKNYSDIGGYSVEMFESLSPKAVAVIKWWFLGKENAEKIGKDLAEREQARYLGL